MHLIKHEVVSWKELLANVAPDLRTVYQLEQKLDVPTIVADVQLFHFCVPAMATGRSLQTCIHRCVSYKDTCEPHHQISNDVIAIGTDPTKTIHRWFAYKKVVQFLYKDLWTVFSPLLAHDPASPKNTIKTNGFEARFFLFKSNTKIRKILNFFGQIKTKAFLTSQRPSKPGISEVLQNQSLGANMDRWGSIRQSSCGCSET